MKKICLFLVLLLPALSCLAQEPYYIMKAGTVLHYERYKASSGKRIQTTRIEVDSIVNTPGGQRVCYRLLLEKGNGRDLYGGPMDQYVDINRQGDVMTDMGKFVEQAMKNLFPRAKVRSEGSQAVMPSRLQPGDTIPGAHADIYAGSLKFTIYILGRSVLRYETITTPAGTFDCIVARERKIEDGPLRHHDNWSDNWYVRGIGYVRHDIYDKDMKLEATEVLTRIETK